MKIDVFHNIRWSRYKAYVFSSLHERASLQGHAVRFFQIADTDGQRTALTGVDIGCHRYPHELLFAGNYSDVPVLRMVHNLFAKVFKSDAELVVLPGYERMEYWAMLGAAILRGRRRAVFCDSTLYDRPQSTIKGWLKRLFFWNCHGFFAYGERSGELLRYYGAKQEVIFQRCQAAALPEGYSVVSARERRTRLAPSPLAPVFLYVGRLSPEKSLDVLLLAFAQINASIPAARLILVGNGPESELLKASTARLKLQSSVEFAGSKDADALAEFYARATCLVLPSRSEPWGLVVNEALHYGCPVVVSHHCGCVPELVHDGVTGFVFKTDEPGDLANKLTRLVEEFQDWAQVADRCMSLISHYSPERAAYQILQGCEAILTKASGQRP